MKQIAVMCASSRFYAFALYVSLWSFLKNSPRLASAADIYIYAFDWDEPLKQIFRSLGDFTIIDYDLPADIECTPFIQRFTPALYSRFEAFSLLEKYERVICLDSDILVQKELFPVLSQFHGPIALTVDDCPTVQHNFLGPIPGYDMSAPCYNAGFLVFNRSAFTVPVKQIRQWLYEMLKKYAAWVYLGDQGLINLMLQEFSLPVEVCSPLYNLPASSGRKELSQAFIVHSTGHRKFWCYYFFKQWVDGYIQWRKAGGGAVPVRKDSRRWVKWVNKKFRRRTIFFGSLPRTAANTQLNFSCFHCAINGHILKKPSGKSNPFAGRWARCGPLVVIAAAKRRGERVFSDGGRLEWTYAKKFVYNIHTGFYFSIRGESYAG